jgi:hypothetical protein
VTEREMVAGVTWRYVTAVSLRTAECLSTLEGTTSGSWSLPVCFVELLAIRKPDSVMSSSS